MPSLDTPRPTVRAALAAALLAAVLSLAAYLVPRIPPARPASPYDRVEAMVAMRDGTKLETVLFVPKSARAGDERAIVLERTPYGVPGERFEPSAELLEGGYILAFQDVRGRFRSEGTFVMLRPPRDAGDPKSVDEATDAYDTIEWLVHEAPHNDGRVCMVGTSYDAWTATMALREPHPALRCISERASPSDTFANDDFHHNGAFRLSYAFEVTALLETKPNEFYEFPFDARDTYDFYLRLGALPHADERYFHGALPTWEEFVRHPDRDEVWERRAAGTAIEQTTVPAQHVAGWWDQEDFVGPLDIYARLERRDAARTNTLVVGPWNHGGWDEGAGRALGDVDFGSDTAKEFRAGAERQWLAHWLKGAPLDVPQARVFETGSNRWRDFEAWPPTSGVTPRRLYLRAGGKLSFDPPSEATGDAFDAYVSDPANPVPYRPRPIGPTLSAEWPLWLVQDQRFAEHRPDVLTYETEPLERDVVVAGDLVADLFASTSGTDADWVVKLIDVLPDGAPSSEATAPDGGPAPDLRGYELMIASEILRARFRNDLGHPEPVPADRVVRYGVDLHPRSHAFLRGHRIMVQVQSTWFPLYDRNPQKYVTSIFAADDADYVAATQRVFRSRDAASSVVLPTLEAP